MKTIKDVLSKYEDELYVNEGKAKAVAKIIKLMHEQDEVQKLYAKRLELTKVIEGRN